MLQHRTIAALSTGTAVAAIAVFAAAPHAQSPPAEFTIVDRGEPSIVLDDVGPKGMTRGRFSLGDRLTIHQAITRDGATGSVSGVATVVTRGRVRSEKARGNLSAVIRLPDGELFVEGVVNFRDDSGASIVVGGTGAYAGMRGTLKREGTGDRVTLQQD